MSGEQIDMAVSALCAREGQGKCLGVYPSVTGIYIAAGSVDKGSDRTSIKPGRGPQRNAQRASRLVYSMRLNLGRFLRGETKVQAQFNGTLMPEIDRETMEYPRGEGVLVRKEEYN